MMTDVKILATGLGFPEGPVVHADGSVVLTEIRNQRCSRVTPDGKVSVFSNCGGGPNGLAIGPDGYFYLCNNGGNRYVEGHSMGLGPHPDYKFGTVERIDPKTGEAKVLYQDVNGHLLSAPNDLVFDRAFPQHAGSYQLMASNQFGTTNSSVALNDAVMYPIHHQRPGQQAERSRIGFVRKHPTE